MSNTEVVALSELSDAELDGVSAAGRRFQAVQVSIGNIAIATQVNNQVNVAVLNFGDVTQGGWQSNNNNAGNQYVSYSYSY